MYRKLVFILCLVLLPAVTVMAKVEGGDRNVKDQNATELSAKELSGMSIVGNDEAPKSLYIVPWKSSEIGKETRLDRMLSEGDVPVDRDEFMRQLDFYQIRTAK